MASSRKSSLTDSVAAHLAPLLPKQSHILVGLSGGLDSVVLLHLLHALAPRFEWRLSALHVHHGISNHADAWAAFCAECCRSLDIPLQVEYVDIAPLREAQGLEAAARQLRRAALIKHECDFVALAHHADDQAETLLLQLLRGAGVKGVAAMPGLKPAAAGQPGFIRPLLAVSRRELLAYAQQHALRWIEDESNADERYPRNFLRHRVLPQLASHFPAYREAMGRSSRHFAEAADLLDDLAGLDAKGGAEGSVLMLNLLHPLSPSRRKNLLRYWLHRQGVMLPQEVQLDEMLHQLLTAREDAQVCVSFADWQVRRFRNAVWLVYLPADFDSGVRQPWQGESELYWPALGETLSFSKAVGQGLSLSRLVAAPVTLRLRGGGERLRPHPKASSRSLKNLLQESAVPPWRRERLPLLYCGDQLACIVGVAVAAEFQAETNAPGICVSLAS